MRWSASLKGAAIAAASSVLGAVPLYLGGGFTGAEVYTLVVLFGTVFFAYLKEHPAE